MFSTKSNIPALNKNHFLSSSAAIGPDWQEKEQQHQLQLLSENAVPDWIKVEDKAISNFLIELADLPEDVPADAENSKEETSNTGNQLSSDAVVDWNRVEDAIINDFFVELEDLPEDIPADAENNKEETGSADSQLSSDTDDISDNVSDKVSDRVSETTTGFKSDKGHYNHSSLKKWKCTICDFTCRISSHLTRHKLIHSDIRPFICQLCSHASKTPSNLKSHQKMAHSTERPYPCDICHKRFKMNAHLKRHKTTHFNTRSFECTSYPNRSETLPDGEWHQESCNKERPYRCDICRKCFKRKEHLNKHKTTHSVNYPYSCDTCNKSFANNYSLLNHQSVHKEEKPFKCEFCHKSYCWEKAMKRHIKQTHYVSQGETPTREPTSTDSGLVTSPSPSMINQPSTSNTSVS